MTSTKEQFISIYKDKITRRGANDLLDYLERSDFFEAPASTKFHGSYAGGLLDHSMNVYKALNKLIEIFAPENYWSEETIAIVSLLHDITKVGFYSREYKNVKEDGRWVTKEIYVIRDTFPCGHGEKSVIMIQKYMQLSDEEILAIRCHMGAFDESVKGGARFLGQAFEQSKLAVLVHLADMIASHIYE